MGEVLMDWEWEREFEGAFCRDAAGGDAGTTVESGGASADRDGGGVEGWCLANRNPARPTVRAFLIDMRGVALQRR
jgi:hypothetical protein